jgi:hypothetical protein
VSEARDAELAEDVADLGDEEAAAVSPRKAYGIGCALVVAERRLEETRWRTGELSVL